MGDLISYFRPLYAFDRGSVRYKIAIEARNSVAGSPPAAIYRFITELFSANNSTSSTPPVPPQW